jgi:hypothetical protein
MRRVLTPMFVASLSVLPPAAVAQETAIVVPISQTEFSLRSPWLTEFRSAFAQGDADTLGK